MADVIVRGNDIPYADSDPYSFYGTPVDGVSGTFAGFAIVGAMLVDKTNAMLFMNTGTKASPVWTPMFPYRNAGAPVNGTAGTGTLAGIAKPGSELIDITNNQKYINAGTQANVTWKQYTRAA